MAKTALKVSGLVFLLIAALHLVRLISGFEVVVGGAPLPLWANGVAFVVTLSLGIWMFRAQKTL